MNKIISSDTSLGYTFFISFLALLYSLMLVFIIPIDAVMDRANYLIYASDSELIFARYFSIGFLSVFTNEPVWLIINVFLNRFFTAENVVFIVIFFSSFISSYLVLKSNPKYFFFLLFILFMPQVVSKYIVHLRQGLAISIFLVGWSLKNTRWRFLLLLITPFIHSSFFFVLFLYFFSEISLKLKLDRDIRSILVVFLGLGLGLGLGYVANLIGARQANEYDFSSANISGLGFIFWFGVFSLYWFQGRDFVRKHAFSISALIFYLSTYFLIEVTGRIFESMIIFVLLASLDLTAWRRKAFILALFLFVLLTWLPRINQPWLGWGGAV
ncbi:EpsG family protein [Shewanella oncorhynchi]|uniref:EpsG family protein n=1 Tax=Shewanella oncorhynchi TaxID=2726434 RepID=UPI003D7A2B75